MIIAGLGIFLAVMLIIGHMSGSKVDSIDDYFIAGRKLSYKFAVPTIVATWFGAGSCMGISSIVYSDGFQGVISDPLGCSLALFLAAFFFVGKLRKRCYLTISDLIRDVYGTKAELFSSLLMLPLYIGVLAAQLVAIGYIFSLFLGFSTFTGTCLGGVIVLTYTSVGGMWAVTVTDFTQFLLVILGLVLLVPITIGALPDASVVWAMMKDEFSTLHPQSLATQGGLLVHGGKLLLTGLGAIMGQDLLQRVFACKSERVAVTSTFTAAWIYLALGIVPLTIGLVGRILLPDLSEPELLIPTLAKDHLSPFMLNVFVIGLLALLMSTADSYLLAGTAIITNNILSKNKQFLLYIRIVNALCIGLAILLGIALPSIFNLMVHSGAPLFVAIFVPVTAGLYFSKATPEAGWCSMLSGLIGWLVYVLYHAGELSTAYESVLYPAALIGASLSLIGYAVPYLYWALISSPTPEDKLSQS